MEFQRTKAADAARPQPTQTFRGGIPYIDSNRPAFDSARIYSLGRYARVRGDERLWLICDLGSESFRVSCLEGVALLVIDVPAKDVWPIVDDGGQRAAAEIHRQREKALAALAEATDTPAHKTYWRARRAMVI